MVYLWLLLVKLLTCLSSQTPTLNNTIRTYCNNYISYTRPTVNELYAERDFCFLASSENYVVAYTAITREIIVTKFEGHG